MHRIKVVAVKTLESGKFDADKADFTNPPKATIKWNESIPLTEAAIYNNSEAVLMTLAEYETITSGKDWMLPESVRAGIKSVATMLLDLLEEKP